MVEPIWAEPIIKEVLELHNRTKAPKIKWTKSNRGGSGYTYYKGKTYRRNALGHIIRVRRKYEISVRLSGKESRDKLILLHELSHWLIRTKHHHDKTFWRKAWSLYFIFLTSEQIEEAKKSEFDYKGKARQVYLEYVQ